MNRITPTQNIPIALDPKELKHPHTQTHKMNPTPNIPIVRDPKILQLEEEEARLVRMAELQDEMFCNRFENGMRKRRQPIRSSSSSPPENNKSKRNAEEVHHQPFMEKQLPRDHSQQIPLSTMLSLLDLHHSWSSSSISIPEANIALVPDHPFVECGLEESSLVSSVLTQSLHILKDDYHNANDEDDHELMFEMDDHELMFEMDF